MRLFLLLIACGALGLVVWYDFSGDISKEPADKSNPDKLQSKKIDSQANQEEISPLTLRNPLGRLEINRLKETTRRPLFSPNRKPPVLVVKKLAPPIFTRAPKKKQSNYLLMGVIRDGERSVALLRENESGRVFRVQKGDVVGSLRVTDVLLKAVKIERQDGSSETIKLKFTSQ